MTTRPPGRSALDLLPAVLVLLSTLAGAAWYRYYLRETSLQFAESFRKQNAVELESGDVFNLSSRLSAVGASVHWTCIAASRGEHPFFRQERGACGSGLFRQRVSVFSPNNQGLAIDFTLRLPRTLELAGGAFLALQASLLVLLFLGVRRVERLRAEGHRRLAELAAQVAHDVRSPLAALKSLLGRMDGMPEEDRRLVRGAVERIQGIAEDLLERDRGGAPAETYPVELGPLLAGVLSEKRLQSPEGVSLEERLSDGVVARAVPRELSRVVSNLIENAVQALNGRGRVALTLAARGEEAVLLVADDGPGIPADVLPRLGARGATFGKEKGSGLGLHHARTAVESWGGRLEIASEVGKGTTVSVFLPLAAAGPADAVLVDDDPLVRVSWAVAARKAGVRLRAYPDAASFIKEAASLDKGTPIYLDSELGEGAKGEDLARDLAVQGFSELHLATGRDPAEFGPLPHIRSVRGKEAPWPSA